MTDQVDVAIKKRLSVLSPDKLKKLKTALLKEQERRKNSKKSTDSHERKS